MPDGETRMSRTSSSAAENQVLAVVGSGRARSRREVSQILSLSASTVSQHVQSLLAQGLIEEGDPRGSTGGRPRASCGSQATPI